MSIVKEWTQYYQYYNDNSYPSSLLICLLSNIGSNHYRDLSPSLGLSLSCRLEASCTKNIIMEKPHGTSTTMAQRNHHVSKLGDRVQQNFMFIRKDIRKSLCLFSILQITTLIRKRLFWESFFLMWTYFIENDKYEAPKQMV